MSQEIYPSLGELKKGDRGIIVRVRESSFCLSLPERLMEMGILEGSIFEVLHEAPFGKDPIAVQVRGALIALRRNEADCVEVAKID